MPLTLSESYDWCVALTRRTAGNFYYSFLALPAPLRRDMCVLYAFMRVSDDLGDDVEVPLEQRRESIERFRGELLRSLAGQPSDQPGLTALEDVVRRHAIPQHYLTTVLDGVASDLVPRTFETYEELSHYCYQVAGVVGLCCIHIWGFHDARAIPCAIECGSAFQLTNILRDLREDMEMGRIYLPQEDMRRFGYTADELSRGVQNEAFRELLLFETARARGHYERARELFQYLEPAGRPILKAMIEIYGGLLDKIERRNFDVFTRRVSLSKWKKLRIAFRAMVSRG